MDNRDLTATPQRWLPRGEALCTSTPDPLVVWQGIPGEKAHIHVYHRGQNRWLGRWKGAVEGPDPHRVEPPCPRCSPCGGCALMHLDRGGQDAARRFLLADAFQESALVPSSIEPTVSSPDGDQAFRHVVKLAAGYSDRGHIRLGAFGRNSRDIIPVPECLVVTPILRKAMKAISHHVIELGVEPYIVEKERGILRYVVCRQSRAHGDVLVTLVASHKSRALFDLAQAVAGSLPEASGIHIHLNDGPGNAIFSEDGTVVPAVTSIAGREEIEETVAGVHVTVGPGEFFQTNPGTAELLYRAVVDAVLPERPVVDLYCGVGGMTLLCADRCGWAVGVEANASAVTRARASAARGRHSAEFIHSEVQEALSGLERRLRNAGPNVVVNPARRGLEDGVIEGILGLHPCRIVYVSCNPRTMARDVGIFSRRGFELTRVVPFDMFPHTAHLETLAVLHAGTAPSGVAVRTPKRRTVGGGKH